MDDAPEIYELTDPAALKALAHPRRQRILEHLAWYGAATSATLARALGLNTGATSYHLRELARHGFVEETHSDGAHGRERWWRPANRDIRFPARSEQDTSVRSVLDEMGRLAIARDMAAFQQAQEAQEAEDASSPWLDAFPYSRGLIRVTPGELKQFFEDYIALLNRYRRPAEEMPADARVVLTRFLAFPAPPKEPDEPD
ncbi:DNA-binding transcriptional ArsR family regulator [Lipingzhangella halophila]|uniref:DNA-binding transcriptional ArsR family regulator n=1 Tax=Lipingzhangella halophila TaxID=1783352 RepID=A0A7W7RNF4_9ACTN|nr:helix-turn-helix domain-containing protein [Lipingzhangella halophila]MBB4935196.1 DNA-binding transcriptional ArsR family regulator [Lipingzhangella halophila]